MEHDPDAAEGQNEGTGRVEDYFPEHVTSRNGQVRLTQHADYWRSLSVAGETVRTDVGQELDALPFMLVAFVCIVAALLGLLVAGLHTMIKYVGCPLGINGCNGFSGPDFESRGFLLIKALDGIPEDLVYVIMAMASQFCLGLLVELLSEQHAKQVLGGGTVQALVAVAAGVPISLTAALLRIVTMVLYFAGAGTLGGDGPTIHVCTAAAGLIGWMVGIRSTRTQSLLASLGFSCGFAATFNATWSRKALNKADKRR